eukprot:CAMPEP_0182463526 /NCGR_PEP_ID=MMETSP1319-20130603/7636_1 /TAXON_ID=172717 /ORGANISM="Bolidomonas pacifica, Strain RCC208" /LENGTH=163 /DNA_ID=CAMNT_0024663085 /DNA_START=44 /DNA_END=535 /DNA_ORIENTATION=+
MAELHAEQNEKAYQKQECVFIGARRVLGKSKGKKALRFSKNVGLGFKTPATASGGVYIDRKCPFTGNVSIRGRILKGIVVSHKMRRTIVVRRDYLHYIKKYKRFEKRHRNIVAHCSPCFDVGEGDVVTIGQCRPLAKTVRFNVLEVEKAVNTALNVKKQFRMF